MIQINVKNKQNVLNWSAKFETQEEADSWIVNEISLNSWGKLERWVKDSQEDVSEAIDTRETEVFPAVETTFDEETGEIISEGSPAITITEHLMPVEYTIEQIDVTAETEKSELQYNGLKRQSVGASVIAKVYSINESKNITPQTFAAMMSDTNLERIERMLWTGSLRTAKLMIQALDNTYFTNDEKTTIIAMIDASGLI